jgi:UDP-N-acetylmuramyl pentapeptide phosphotransferase/UDP-N-acetylglucosamine-1-phosphate transferase
VLQGVAVGVVLLALPAEFQLLPFLPPWIERGLLLLAGLWFVNLVNFMDGIDWLTVVETASLCGAVVLVALLGGIGALPALAAAALLGAILGFAPYNKPVARLFLGDVGSLPIGLLLGWMLLALAGKGHVAAAVLLPLYYLADATITLFRRMVRGEPFWQAHRSHFYQRATDNGYSVREIIARVAAVNAALAALALTTIAAPSLLVTSLALAAGAALVAWLLISFARGSSENA